MKFQAVFIDCLFYFLLCYDTKLLFDGGRMFPFVYFPALQRVVYGKQCNAMQSEAED